MKIVLLTQFFYPDIQATSRIFYELCEDLAKYHSVKVITGPPFVRADGVKTVKYGRTKVNPSFTVETVFATRRAKKTVPDRITNHLTFICSAFIKFLFSLPSCAKTDVFIYTSDNPLNFIGCFFFPHKPKLFLCKDLYLEQGIALGVFKNGLTAKLLGKCQRLSFHWATKIVVIGWKMRDYLVKNMSIPSGNVEIIPDWADTNELRPMGQDNIFSRKYDLHNKFVVLHAGRIGHAQDVEMLLSCADRMRDSRDIKFLIIGEGVNKKLIQAKARGLSLENVMILPYQSKELFESVMSAASASVILYKEHLSEFLIPSKLYNIMASGRPIIATAEPESDIREIIQKSGAGIIIKPRDADYFKDAILTLYRNRDKAKTMGDNGRSYVVNNFARPMMTERYRRLIEKLAAL